VTKHKEEEKTKTEKAESITLSREDHEKLKESARLAEEFKDRYQRAHAELDNARKRMSKEKEAYVKYANESLFEDIIYVIDNFDRALDHMNGTQKVESVLQGIKMIQKQFHLLLEQKGVTKIEAVGKKFDPALHEAVEHLESDESEDGVVMEEIQPGYSLNGRLLRPSVVKVGKKR